jgi:IS5 family transposase
MRKTAVALQQTGFSQAEYNAEKKLTRRNVFLAKMEQVVPWSRLIAVVEPHYPKSGKRGRQAIGVERVLRMYFIQQ